MRHTLLAALLLAALPAVALAGDRHRYDRGDRYRDWGRSRASFDFSVGFGGGSWRGDDYYVGFRYRNWDYPTYRSRYYCPPPVVYTPPPVVYTPPPVLYMPPPVVVYPAPTYYYNPCPPAYYYSETRYYYGR